MSCEIGMLSKRLTNSVQVLSLVLLFVTPWTAARQAFLSITKSQNSLKLMSIESVMTSNHLIICCRLLLLPFNISKHSDLFQWISSLHHVASMGVSVSVSVLPMNIQDWFPLGWTGENLFQSKGLSRVFSNTTVQKHQFFGASFLYSPTFTSIHDYRENHSFDKPGFVGQVMSLLFNMLSVSNRKITFAYIHKNY